MRSIFMLFSKNVYIKIIVIVEIVLYNWLILHLHVIAQLLWAQGVV